MPTVAQRARMVTTAAIVAAPPTEFVAERKTSMNGNPVFDWSAASISPRQNNSAMVMPNPRLPFMMMLNIIDRGITTEGLWISSAI